MPKKGTPKEAQTHIQAAKRAATQYAKAFLFPTTPFSPPRYFPQHFPDRSVPYILNFIIFYRCAHFSIPFQWV